MKNLYTFSKRILLTLLLCMAACSAMAQINISIQFFPPFEYRMQDYASHPEKVQIIITNTSTVQHKINVLCMVNSDNNIRVRPKSNYKLKTPIVMNPGEVKMYNGANLATLLDFSQMVLTGISWEKLNRTNGLPEGNYTVCMTAFDYDTGEALSGVDPVGCSNPISITNIEPPLITSPYDGQEIQLPAQSFVIAWTTPPGAPPTTQYRVRIAEIVDGRPPQAALLSQLEPYFFDKTVMGNQYFFQPDDPLLSSKAKYALMVQAIDPLMNINFRNEGQSAVISFKGKAPDLPSPAIAAFGGGMMGGPTFVPIVFTEPAPLVDPKKPNQVKAVLSTEGKVDGEVKWSVRDSEYGNNSGSNYSYTEPNTFGQKPMANQLVTVKMITTTYQLRGTPVGLLYTTSAIDEATVAAQAESKREETEVLGTATTDASGKYSLDITNYAAEQANQLAVAYVNKKYFGPGPRMTGVYKTYKLIASIDDKRFTIPEKYLALDPDRKEQFLYSTALANTVRLQPQIRSANGKDITKDAIVRVYRKSDFYDTNPIFKGEGYIQPGDDAVPARINEVGDSYMKIGTPNKEDGSFRALFYNTGNDWFLVSVTAKGHRPYYGRVEAPMADENVGSLSAATVLAPEIKLESEVPIWKGYVGTAEKPLMNAVVSLKVPKQYWKPAKESGDTNGFETLTVVTDDKGQFKMPLTDSYLLCPDPLDFSVAVTGDPAAYDGTSGKVLVDQPGVMPQSHIQLRGVLYRLFGKVLGEKAEPLEGAAITVKSTGHQEFSEKGGGLTLRLTSTRVLDTITAEAKGYMKLYWPIESRNGIGNMQMIPKYLYRVTVKNKRGEVIKGATMGIRKANANDGDAYFTAAGGDDGMAERRMTDNIYSSYQITVPDGSLYAPQKGSIAAMDPVKGLNSVYDKALNAYVIGWTATLDDAVILTGKVTDGNKALAGVKISVGKSGSVYTTTDAEGKYTLLKKQGPDSLYAIMAGYRTEYRYKDYQGPTTVDITMPPAQVKSLFGIDIAVSKLEEKNGAYTISGQFINIPSNNSFTVDPKVTLSFSNVKLKFEGDKLVPVESSIKTESTSISVKGFGFLPLTLTGTELTEKYASNIYVVKSAANGGGVISGSLSVYWANINPKNEFNLVGSAVLLNKPGTEISRFPVLGPGAVVPEKLYIRDNYVQPFTFNKYWLTADLKRTTIQADGFHFAGNLDIGTSDDEGDGEGLGVIDLLVDKELKKSTFKVDPVNNKFNVGVWKMTISDGIYSPNGRGIIASGSMDIESKVLVKPLKTPFKNANFGAGMSGGEFFVTDTKVQLSGMIDFFPSTGSSWTVSSDNGDMFFKKAGDIAFKKYIDNKLPLNNLSIGTEDNLDLNAPLNVKLNFENIAKINLEELHYVAEDDGNHIDINGSVEFNITEHFKAKAGDFSFYTNKLKVGSIGAKIECGELAEAEFEVEFIDEEKAKGFKGSGEVSVKEVFTLGLGVTYIKTDSGTVFGGSFKLGGKKNIPIGSTGFGFTKVGGKFQYDTGSEDWMFGINGTIEDLADITKIEGEVEITVEPGPVVTGTVSATFADTFELLKGEICLDVPEKKLTISLEPNLNLIPGVSAAASGFAMLGADGASPYMFVGVTAKMNAFGIFKADASACIGVNYNAVLHSKDIPDFYPSLADVFKEPSKKFTGFNVKVDGGYDFGWSRKFVDIGIASASGNYATHFKVDGHLYCSLTEGIISAKLKTDWGMSLGVDVKVFGKRVCAINGAVGLGVDFAGTINCKEQYITLDASAYGYVAFNWNEDGCDNDSGFIYAQACIKPSISVGYDSRKSSPFAIHW